MNTDTAVLLLIADLQRDKATLQQRVNDLEAQLAELSAGQSSRE